MKKQIKTVRILWTENNGTKDRDYPGLAEVNRDLRDWAKSAPEKGCYDKTEFLVTWEDGESWQGRIDLQKCHATDLNVIENHIREFINFEIGEYRPAHLSAKQYADYLATNSPEHTASLRDYLENYDLG